MAAIPGKSRQMTSKRHWDWSADIFLLVIVKHQGTKYDVELDPEATGETFKFQLYSLTNVEPERQKVLIKGGQLKDDTPLSSLNAKKGQVFMMTGTPSGDPNASVERPTEKIRFLEDMTAAEAAQVEGAMPAGLQNLGNTCYLNSALQTLRSIPELSEALGKYSERCAIPVCQSSPPLLTLF